MKLKSLFAILLLLATPTVLLAKGTAYDALRSISVARGKAVLNHVLEVSGKSGNPQPHAWKVILDDSSARGGIREITVKNGQIVSERTPLRRSVKLASNAVMNFRQLNLDSTGVFKLTNREARASHIGFDVIDYTLRADDASGSPVWVLQLLDANGQSAGTLYISAANGKVLRREGFDSTSATSAAPTYVGVGTTTQNDNQYDSNQQAIPPTNNETQYPADQSGAPQEDHGVKHTIKKSFLDVGRSISNFFNRRDHESDRSNY